MIDVLKKLSSQPMVRPRITYTNKATFLSFEEINMMGSMGVVDVTTDINFENDTVLCKKHSVTRLGFPG
jgi:hypothetical protein